MNTSAPKNIRHAMAAEKAIAELRELAAGGDFVAISLLVDVARNATRAVHSLFENETPTTPAKLSGWFRKPDEIGAARREALNSVLGFSPVPTLHFWRDGGEEAVRQTEVLRHLEHGPLTGRAHESNPVHVWWRGGVMPVFLRIRHGKKPDHGWQLDAWNLPRLSHDSIEQWVDAAVSWLWEDERFSLRIPGSPLFRLADPDSMRRKDIVRKAKRMSAARGKLARKSRGVVEVADEWKLTAREERITKTKITDAHIKGGLRMKFVSYLRRALKATT